MINKGMVKHEYIFLLEVKFEIDRYKDMIKSEEQLKEFLKNISSFEEVNEEELKMFVEYYKTKEDKVVKNYISEKIKEMSDEEKVNSIIEITNPWGEVGDNEILELLLASIQDKNKILDRSINFVNTDDGKRILNSIEVSILAKYIKTNWKKNSSILQFFMNEGKAIDILNQMNEVEKTNFVMENVAPRSGNINVSDLLNRIVFEIKDDFCRKILIIYIRSESNIEVKEFQKITLEYEKIKEELEKITEENKKTEFITNLQDNELKVVFLEQIKSKQNRKTIIQSLTKNIDTRIESHVKLAQKMINEFFEDKMGEKLTEEQKEKLAIAFAKTSVNFEELESNTNGIARNLYDSISISSRHLNNPSKTLLFLLHEYGHILSFQNLKKDNYIPNHDIEEGMQDLFSELVINHYLEKHGKIELDGRKVRMEYPCKSYSAYDSENSWTRTMLYPLERQGKDIEAITQYILGDKNTFLEMTLGKQNAESKPTDLFGNKFINTSWKELYEQMPEGFEDDEIVASIYGRRNNFLPFFILQKKLEKTDIKFFELEENSKYNCDYVAEKYFQGRKLYEISYKEMARFNELYDGQNEIIIFKYDKFFNNMINELTEEEVEQYSTEILETSLLLARRINKIGTNLEKVWSLALEKERKNVKGQNVIVSINKYKKFINTYITLLSKIKSDASEYLMDSVKDLNETYLQQIEENIISGNISEVLEGLTNSEDGTIYTNQEILELFEKLDVRFEEVQIMGTSYKSQDIIESAIRAKLKLNDVKQMSVIFENDRIDNLIGERSND